MKYTSHTLITPQGQTTIPKEIRKALGIKPGEKVVWQLSGNNNGVTVNVSRSEKYPFLKLRGIARDFYQEFGGAAKYLEDERNQWDS